MTSKFTSHIRNYGYGFMANLTFSAFVAVLTFLTSQYGIVQFYIDLCFLLSWYAIYHLVQKVNLHLSLISWQTICKVDSFSELNYLNPVLVRHFGSLCTCSSILFLMHFFGPFKDHLYFLL